MEFALGWLGWSEEQALWADVNAIIVAQRGRANLLTALFGKKEKDGTAPQHGKFTQPERLKGSGKVKPDPPKLTAAAFDAMFG